MRAETDALANVYARSLYELADEAGGQQKIQEIGTELEQICALAREQPDFREFISSPIIDKRKRAESLRQIFSDRVTDLTLRFLLVLNGKKRLNHLEAIATAYDALIQEQFGRVEVDVFTPEPLNQAEIDMIRQRVQQMISKEPVMHAYTEPAMIGGIKLRIGDRLVDGSISSRLRRMRQELLGSGGAQLRSRINELIPEGEET